MKGISYSYLELLNTERTYWMENPHAFRKSLPIFVKKI